MKLTRSEKKRGASILVLSFFFMTILFLLAAALYKIVPAEFHAARRGHDDMEAHYVARSGLQETMSWLEYQIGIFAADQKEQNLPDYNTGTETSPVFDNIEAFEAKVDGKSVTGDPNWTVDIQILPLQTSLGSKHGFEPRLYSVRSTALLRGKPIKTIDVLLRQRTFASFAFYTDQTDPNSKFVIAGKSTIFGPVHTNNYFRFEAVSGLWGDANAKPYFTDVVSHAKTFASSPDGNEWIGGASNSPDTNSDGGSYDKVFSKGRDGLRSKNPIELPQSTGDLVSEAWPISNVPTEQGLHVAQEANKVEGGIYIKGDVSRLELLLDAKGNQRIVSTTYNEVLGTRMVTNRKGWENITDEPKDRVVTDYSNCVEYYPDNGSVGGVNGGSVNNCKKYGTKLTWRIRQIDLPDAPTNVVGHNFFEVFEVTEGPVSYTDENGVGKTAQVGKTLFIEKVQEQDENGVWQSVKTVKTAEYDGQINGTIYVDGNIGPRTDSGSNGSDNGLWGIAKGSAIQLTDGTFKLDSDGNREYLNKTIVTPLDKSINLSGDLLQFNQAKFDAEKAANTNFAGSFNGGKQQNWSKAALDPNRLDGNGDPDPELSPNNDHVLGLVTRDVWMKGRKDKHIRNGYDGVNDIYAVMLAGKKNTNGTTAGGFGTWYAQRDNGGDGLGKFRVLGGVIQGTTSANPGENSNYSHYWVSGSVGYDVEMVYDIEATRQRLFPTFPEFRLIRYLERSARQ